MLFPDFKLGVLGGGQLGRMLIQSAIDLNLNVWIMDPDANAPCSQIATKFIQGSITDFDSVYNFGKQCDLVTIEIENVNAEALQKLADEGVKVFPQPQIIQLIKDKQVQKQFYKKHKIPTADFILTANKAEVEKNKDFLPAVQKLAREGYDGRGVQRIANENELHKAFEAPGVLEKMIDFEKELSVIVARNLQGQVVTYPVVELVFHPEANLVEYLFAPASISTPAAEKAQKIAVDVIEKLDMIGLLAVEMFLEKDGNILVNEIAPRTHNSGHQTIESNFTSQFEQHLRAILNLPLGATENKIPAAMVNLLGEEGYTGPARYDGLDKVLALDGVYVHLYGKKLTKPFRKMGHVTVIDHNMERLKDKAMFVKQNLKVIA